jgi:inner membrane protein
MLLFAHTGITLGAAAVISSAANYRGKAAWTASLSKYLDIRLLVIGSMLPDIIDKPVGQYFFRETFENGRIFSHTLLFLLLLAAGGWLLHRQKKAGWLLALAAGTLAHLVLDQMWNIPQTLLWPLMGWQFPAEDLTGWGENILRSLFSNPMTIVTESIGLIILVWFAVMVAKRKQIGAFLKTGRVAG